MPQIADRKSMARYICVDKGATHPALQREELPKHMAIYADYGVTGTDLRQRPELNRLLTDCRAGRVNCIVVQSTTHLACRTADLLTILQEFNYCAAGDDDPTTMQIKRACKEFKPTDTFPESFYSSIVSKIILHLDTHIDIKLRNGQTL